jgi:sugar lactone lactonase YvrE
MASPLRIAKGILFRDRDQHAIPVMDGNLSPNDVLDQCQVLRSFDAMPDDVVIDNNGDLFVSAGHDILKYSPHQGGEWETIATLPNDATGLDMHPDGRLLVCISGEGLAAISTNGEIEWLRTSEGVALLCPMAVTAASDGTIYVAEGSATNVPNHWVQDLMQGNASGRLVRCEPDLTNAITIRSNLAYPHGLTMTDDEQSLIFSESWAHTISRCDRDGGHVEKLVRNLPGYPAQLASDGAGGYWLSLFAVRTHLVELVLSDRNFKSQMMAEIEPKFWISPSLRATGNYMEPLQGGGIKKLGIIKPWAPPRSYGLVVHVDKNGEIIEGLHSRVGGGCHGVTSARPYGDDVFIVSKGHRKLVKHELRPVS